MTLPTESILYINKITLVTTRFHLVSEDGNEVMIFDHESNEVSIPDFNDNYMPLAQYNTQQGDLFG